MITNLINRVINAWFRGNSIWNLCRPSMQTIFHRSLGKCSTRISCSDLQLLSPKLRTPNFVRFCLKCRRQTVQYHRLCILWHYRLPPRLSVGHSHWRPIRIGQNLLLLRIIYFDYTGLNFLQIKYKWSCTSRNWASKYIFCIVRICCWVRFGWFYLRERRRSI